MRKHIHLVCAFSVLGGLLMGCGEDDEMKLRTMTDAGGLTDVGADGVDGTAGLESSDGADGTDGTDGPDGVKGCKQDGDCKDTQYCDNGVCVAKKLAGADCTSNDECVSKSCTEGKCAKAGGVALDCTGKCKDDEYCQAKGPKADQCLTKKDRGEACSSDGQCTSEKCTDGKCGESGPVKTLGCLSHSKCDKSQYCKKKVGTKLGECTDDKKSVSTCTDNEECASSKCEKAKCQGLMQVPGGKG